jgi:hypothetical protein
MRRPGAVVSEQSSEVAHHNNPGLARSRIGNQHVNEHLNQDPEANPNQEIPNPVQMAMEKRRLRVAL